MFRSHIAAGSSTITYSETSLTISRNKDWASRALQALPDFLHVVSSDGRIRYASDSCKAVVGHESAALMGQDVHSFIHPDDLDVFTREFQEAFIHGHPARFIYRFWSQAKEWVVIESQCNLYRDERANSTANFHELIFMARPYVNEIGAFFDSFLEQKLVHEVLKRQISQLQDSEDEDEDNMHYDESLQPCDSVRVETDYTFHPQAKTQAQMEGSFTVSEPRSAGKSAYLRELDTAIARADHGVLVGDLGIPVTIRTSRNPNHALTRKKKKLEKSELYICRICGTVDSPERRKGPDGPKTLCNSCGLRWSKGGRDAHKALSDRDLPPT